MTRTSILFTYSALAGLLGALVFLLGKEVSHAKTQQQRAAEDAAARHQHDHG